MVTPATTDAGSTHHALPLHELLLVLETDPRDGLTEAEAALRLKTYGRNELPETRRTSPLVRLLRQVNNPLIYVLLAAGLVTLLLGEYVDSSVIFGVVVVNTVIGFLQESKAEAALDALRSMVRTEARVVRDGHQRAVPSEELVPGDLVLVEAGDKLPADLRLVGESELQVDESALTGESLPVEKDEVVLPEGTPVADRRNMVYSGTFVTGGTGRGVAVATGSGTEIGEIHRLVGSATSLETPLTRNLAYFSKRLTAVILGLAAFTFAVGVARGETPAAMFTAAVALAVGAIPEGLPAAVTVTLAIGVSRMAKRHAVVRRLPVVETLGSATVICSDKTGTLTENQMTVRTVWTPRQELTVTGDGYAPDGTVIDQDGSPLTPDTYDAATRWCLAVGANCNDAKLVPDGIVGDPTEAAMLVAARKAGVPLHDLPRVASMPFSSDRQYMATLHEHGEGRKAILVKGGLERVLDLCSVQMGADGSPEELDRSRVEQAANRLAAQGMRVLVTAVDLDASQDDLSDGVSGGLALVGLQVMFDPPRATAAPAIASCKTAGLLVKMITGDHAVTASAIAEQIGLLEGPRDGQVLTGQDLMTLDAAQLPDAVERASVFARVSPEQKLRLVQALQSRHHVVAMTGDGVNDAPALKQADIGVAMGRGGTEVAKEAADMVLLDDDFATIEAAVEEGRGVFDNITKFIVWTLPTNTAEGLVILVAVLLGSALPILPTQILWINMTTAVLLGLTLAWEPKEPGIMTRPPRDPQKPLMTRALVYRTLLVSALLMAGSWTLFNYELDRGSTLEVARTSAMNVFVTVEAFYLFSCRSLTGPSWRLGLFSNPYLIGGVTLQALCQAAITYVPAMNDLFHTAPIDGEAWLRIFAVAVLATMVVAVDKYRMSRQPA